MAWSALFDNTHILRGVPVDAEIELKCNKCGILFRTLNAYHVGYSEVNYLNPDEADRCSYDHKVLQPTGSWFPSREIHKKFADGSWASLFDYSHIVEGAPIDAEIELQCRQCKTLFLTKNCYYISYSEIHYANPEEHGRCKHSLKDLKPTKRFHTI
jgi:uncharacterized C2H2 Zn-finger protein